jgi:hypothetical protein
MVGRGNMIRVGEDPENYMLSNPLKNALSNREIYSLANAADQGTSSIWNQGSKSAI